MQNEMPVEKKKKRPTTLTNQELVEKAKDDQ